MTLRDFLTRMGLDPLAVLDQDLDTSRENVTVQTALTHDIGNTILTIRVTQTPA